MAMDPFQQNAQRFAQIFGGSASNFMMPGQTPGLNTESSSSSFQGIENPEALGILLNYIRGAAGGGSADYTVQRNKRNQALLSLQQSMQDFSNDAAFSDAAALMELNLQRSMEKAMPAISKGIQGAGTSAGSMQALMSNRIAQEAALSAGALGAEQAKAYGSILANMHGTAENFTRIDTQGEQNLLKALDLLRVGRSQSNSQGHGQGGMRAGSGGGGSGGGGFSSGGGYAGMAPRPQAIDWAPSHFNPGPGDVGNLDGWGRSSSSSGGSEPFFYDDWGLGSDGNGGMSGAGFNNDYDSSPYHYDDWGTGSNGSGDMASNYTDSSYEDYSSYW